MEVLGILGVNIVDLGVLFGITNAATSAYIIDVVVVMGTTGRAAQGIETTVRGGAMRSRCLLVV